MAEALNEVRVLDLAEGKAMVAGSMLAKLGADVIAVEPPAGSPSRALQGGFVWSALAAGKRGVTCDLATAADQADFAALALVADIVITGGECPSTPQLDLAPLMRDNPRLIHVSITPFGEDGPKSGQAATDLTIWAASGPLYLCREGERPPLRISSDQAMLHAGSDAAVGALVALAGREKTGRGQKVSVSAQQSVMQATLSSVLAHEVGHEGFTTMQAGPKPEPGKKKALDLSGSGSKTRRSKWEAKDGVVEMHLAMGPAAGRFTNNLFAWLNSIGAVSERVAGWDWIRQVPDDLTSGALTDDDMEDARAEVAAAFACLTRDEILAATMRHRLILAPVLTIEDLGRSAHLASRNAFTTVHEGGVERAVPSALTGSNDRPLLRGAPLIGEHDAEVRADWTARKAPAQARSAPADILPLAGL